MSMSSIRRSFLRAAQRQVRTAQLGHPILRLILGLAFALDIAAGHPLWLTVAVVGAIAAMFWRGARKIRRAAAAPAPSADANPPSPDSGATSPEESP
jgi:hypothetical protein